MGPTIRSDMIWGRNPKNPNYHPIRRSLRHSRLYKPDVRIQDGATFRYCCKCSFVCLKVLCRFTFIQIFPPWKFTRETTNMGKIYLTKTTRAWPHTCRVWAGWRRMPTQLMLTWTVFPIHVLFVDTDGIVFFVSKWETNDLQSRCEGWWKQETFRRQPIFRPQYPNPLFPFLFCFFFLVKKGSHILEKNDRKQYKKIRRCVGWAGHRLRSSTNSTTSEPEGAPRRSLRCAFADGRPPGETIGPSGKLRKQVRVIQPFNFFVWISK